jgi:hypothetical protein
VSDTIRATFLMSRARAAALQGPGHLFLVKADLLKIRCDAWLLPSDDVGSVASPWHQSVGLDRPGRIKGLVFTEGAPVVVWEGSGMSEQDPLIFIGEVGTPRDRPPETVDWVQHLAEVARRFIELAAAESRRRRPGQRPRLAMPLIGTRKAGLKDLVGDLLGPLINSIEDAVRVTGADVVLCVVEDLHWSSVQYARQLRGNRTDWLLSPEMESTALDLKSRLQSKSLVLFLGAGVSAEAGLPEWEALLQAIGRTMGLTDELLEGLRALDQRDAAKWLERRYEGEKKLSQLVADELKSDRFGLTHAVLASMTVQAAVTTNFDSLFEQACTLPGEASTAPIRLPYESAEGDRPWLLKLHGDLDEDDLVFTRSDYLGADRNRAALFGIVQAMLVTRHLLFVGYSLKDEDFHRLFDEIETALHGKERTHLGTVLVIDKPLWAELWEGSLDVVSVGEDDPTSNARTLQVLLDRVNHLAADWSRFLLDRRYENILTDSEKRLSEHLSGTSQLLDALPEDSPVRGAVEKLLSEIGLRGKESDAN